MRTIALRFTDPQSLLEGTIELHKRQIRLFGSTWWGKRGKSISQKNADAVLGNMPSVILLVHSGKRDRWWAYVDEVTHNRPNDDAIPDMYKDDGASYGCWFHVTRIEKAPDDVMSWCILPSNGKLLSQASVFNRNSYFIVDYHGLRPPIS